MFFLQKILVSKSRSMDARLDIDYLVSLDSEIYKNLLYLKGNFQQPNNLDDRINIYYDNNLSIHYFRFF